VNVAYSSSVTVQGSSVTSIQSAGFGVATGRVTAAVALYRTPAITAITVAIGTGLNAANVPQGVVGTLVANTTISGGGVITELYQVVNPDGGTQKVSASWTTASSVELAAVVATGTQQLVSGNNATAFATSVNVTVQSNVGDMTVTAIGTGSPDINATSNRTRRTIGWGSMDTGPGTAGPITHTWTDASEQLNVAGANFVQWQDPAAGSSPALVLKTVPRQLRVDD
jgi:hypothetical protein